MLRKDLITCQQAAVILGRSPSTISRALAQGRLKYADPTRKLLLRQGLEQRFANVTRPKADCPQKAQRDDKAVERLALIPEPPGSPETKTSYWPATAPEAHCRLLAARAVPASTDAVLQND